MSISKLPEGASNLTKQEEDIFTRYKLNDLIDLVNSQQEAIKELRAENSRDTQHQHDNVEAIGELQTEIGVLRNMVLQSQEAIEKLQEHVDHEARHVSEPADDKPKSKNYKLVTESEPFDRVEYEKAKFVRDREKVRFAGFDTHRTVSLRIPKGMSIVEAIEEAYQDTIIHTDTDLQKALDEVKGESNE